MKHLEQLCRSVLSFFFTCSVSSLVVLVAAPTAMADPVVPGTGRRITEVGDDFESPDWKYVGNFPKVYNQKEESISKNYPGGKSKNGRWFEGMKRGQPDYIRRVSTPSGGLAGSTGSLALRTLQTGIARRPSHVQQQDDFIASVMNRFGKIPASRTPNVVTRVWLPPVESWEDRTGCHFAFRLALENRTGRGGSEQDGRYWPGMFIDFKSKDGRRATKKEHDYAVIRVRAKSTGREYYGKQISQTGWWTMGMSVTSDGMMHYYAAPGVDDLTEEDFIASHYPYGYRARNFRTFFFNVCNGDDNKTWSTEFIVDDPMVYVVR